MNTGTSTVHATEAMKKPFVASFVVRASMNVITYMPRRKMMPHQARIRFAFFIRISFQKTNLYDYSTKFVYKKVKKIPNN